MQRVLRIAVLFVFAVLAALELGQAAGMRVVLTDSVPRGVYWIVPIHDAAVGRATLVFACVPVTAVTEARALHILPAGSCPGHVAPVVKYVRGIPGDAVAVTATAVSVDGVALEGGPPMQSPGGPSHQPFGTRTLGTSQYWLASDHPDSWDSRYFGPVVRDGILGRAQPLFTIDKEKT